MAKKTYDPNIVGEQIKQLLMFVQTIPDEALKDTIKFIDEKEAIGPLLDPTAFMGNKFKELRNRKKRCKAVLEFKKVLKETNEEDVK